MNEVLAAVAVEALALAVPGVGVGGAEEVVGAFFFDRQDEGVADLDVSQGQVVHYGSPFRG